MTNNGSCFYIAFLSPYNTSKSQTLHSALFQEYVLVSIQFWSTLKEHVNLNHLPKHQFGASVWPPSAVAACGLPLTWPQALWNQIFYHCSSLKHILSSESLHTTDFIGKSFRRGRTHLLYIALIQQQKGFLSQTAFLSLHSIWNRKGKLQRFLKGVWRT